MANLRDIRASLVDASRRSSRVAHEVEDLVQDVLLSAWRRGLDFEGETFLRVAHGAVRRHGAFLARSAQRRRAREHVSGHAPVAQGELLAFETERQDSTAPLSVLSPALRTTLQLLLLGLEKAELRMALGVTDTALRKRFEALRAHGPLTRPELHLQARTPTLFALRQSQVRLLPRLTGDPTRPAERLLATSDPDGHGLIFAEVLTKGGGAATSGRPRVPAHADPKGTPC